MTTAGDGYLVSLSTDTVAPRLMIAVDGTHVHADDCFFDLAQVTIKAAERELKRSQWAWDMHVIPERDYQRAIDDVSTAKLNFEHARDTAGLERDSLALELRTKRLERDRQALVVASLTQRVVELNREGREVWQFTTDGRPWRARRR